MKSAERLLAPTIAACSEGESTLPTEKPLPSDKQCKTRKPLLGSHSGTEKKASHEKRLLCPRKRSFQRESLLLIDSTRQGIHSNYPFNAPLFAECRKNIEMLKRCCSYRIDAGIWASWQYKCTLTFWPDEMK